MHPVAVVKEQVSSRIGHHLFSGDKKSTIAEHKGRAISHCEFR